MKTRYARQIRKGIELGKAYQRGWDIGILWRVSQSDELVQKAFRRTTSYTPFG